MRKLLFAGGMLACLTLGSIPATAQTIFLTPSTSDTLACGETYAFTMDINSGISDLRAYTVYIQYDGTRVAPVLNGSNYVTLPTFACGAFLADEILDGPTLDTLKVDVGLLGCSVNGPASVINFEFESLVSSANLVSTTINILNGPTSLRDSNNNVIFNFAGSNAMLRSLCNSKPIAVDDGGVGFTTGEDVAFVTGNVLANDSDPDALDTVSLSGFDATGAVGAVTSNGNGTFNYTPPLDYSGTDGFDYFITDGTALDTASVTITINALNDPPMAFDDDVSTSEDTLVVFNVLVDNGNGADTDVDDTINPATTAVVVASGPSNGSLVNNGDGTFDYTPAPDYNGADSFRYTVDDFVGDTSNEATVNITVVPVNDPPVAQDDVAVTVEDTAIALNLLNDNGNGPDTDDEGLQVNSVAIVTDVTNGSTSVNGGTGVVTYTPAPNYVGADQFTYTVNDLQGETSNLATVSLTVTPVNDAPTITAPGNQTNAEQDVVSLQIVADDVDTGDVLEYVATGLPSTLSINSATGLIDGLIDCGEALNSPFAISVKVNDGVDTTQVGFSWTVTQSTPAVVSALTAAQELTANLPNDGTTQITLNWSRTLLPSELVKIYRKSYGDYPEYAAGSAPTAPTSTTDAVANGWTLVDSVSAETFTDDPPSRDYWYYVAFVVNACAESPVSALTTGTLSYHLGDFTDGTVLPNPGDNLLNFNDVGLFGDQYGNAVDALNNVLDIGPTTGGSVNTRPNPDNVIGFEDLVLLSINFGSVSKPGLNEPSFAAGNALTVTVPELPAPGELFPVTLDLESNGSIKALSVALRWNSDVVEPAGFEAGELMSRQAGTPLVLSATPGTVDATVLGSSLAGAGQMATVMFRVKTAGIAGLEAAEVIARGETNQPVALAVEEVRNGPGLPALTRLLPSAPNPFRAQTVVAFDLAKESRVHLSVFGVNGALVRTLAEGEFPAGAHQFQWDGRSDGGAEVAAGIYLIRFQAENQSASSRVVRIR